MIRLALLAAAAIAACSSGSIAEPGFDANADLRVLFVGNSLTYTHDVPRLVRRLAAERDVTVSTIAIAHPDFSLEDHWQSGIADEIRRLRADIVVMQQGPSSLPENREHLVHWSQQLAAVAQEAGGQAALYMVWPDATRMFAFPDVEAAYADAAAASDALLFPAGTTWLRAWDADPDLQLYGPDGFHPSYTGALAAALTIAAVALDIPANELPDFDDSVSAATMTVLRAAVAASLAQWP